MVESADLTELLKAVQAGAAERELAVYQGLPTSQSRHPDAHWGGDWAAYLELARRAGAALL